MRFVRPRLLQAAPLALGLALLLPALSLADDPTVEAGGGVYGYYWTPANVSVAPGGSVTFRNPSASVLHGVSWQSGSSGAPSCSGVPIDDAKTSWTGTCAFVQSGTYSFYCPVHPAEMKGTITAAAAGPPDEHVRPVLRRDAGDHDAAPDEQVPGRG